MSTLLIKKAFLIFAVPVFVFASALTAHAATIGLTGAIGGARVGTNFVVGQEGTTFNTNSWPSYENPGFAIDPLLNTKYLNFSGQDSGLIVSPTGPNASVAPNALSIWTADDATHRDPASFAIYGSLTPLTNSTPGTVYDLAAMTLIAGGPIFLPDGRISGPTTVTFANTTAYASYAILFPTIKDPSTQDIMQIAELSLSGDPVGATPVPEPASVLLVGTGVAALIRRRMRGSNAAR